MTQHNDPTFAAVAARQARDCTGCRNRMRLWGMEFCEQGKWKGAANMRRCSDYRRAHAPVSES